MTHPIVAASEEFADAARRYVRALADLGDELSVLLLPDALSEVVSYVASGDLADDLVDLRDAWEVIESGRPVAATQESARGLETRWLRPLSPAELLTVAHRAASSDRPYRLVLHDALTFAHDRERRREDAHCGRPTKTTGAPCQALPAYSPGGLGFNGGAACHVHRTLEEAVQLELRYREAIANLACPGCSAAPGQECTGFDDEDSDVQPVDGVWPRLRRIGHVQVHDVRLDLVPLPRTKK